MPGGSVAVIQILLAKEVKMDYKYNIVRASLIRASVHVYRSMANAVTEFLTVAESK